jgi:hypothetical protein
LEEAVKAVICPKAGPPEVLQVTGVCSIADLDLVRSIGLDDTIDYTREEFTREAGFSFEVPEYSKAARTFLGKIPLQDYPHFRQLAQLVAERRYNGGPDFDFGLELILDGLERYRDKS